MLWKAIRTVFNVFWNNCSHKVFRRNKLQFPFSRHILKTASCSISQCHNITFCIQFNIEWHGAIFTVFANVDSTLFQNIYMFNVYIIIGINSKNDRNVLRSMKYLYECSRKYVDKFQQHSLIISSLQCIYFL